MIFTLDVRRARKGDCLLLHYGTAESPGLMLVDGGPAQVYGPFLRPRLLQIRAARKIPDEKPLPADIVMVSHIDDDHINGMLELTKELVTAADVKKPALLKIRSFWHNSFDDIIGDSPKELLASVTASFGPAGLAGELDAEGFDADAAQVLAGVAQGNRLRDDIRKLKVSLNKELNGKLILAAAEPLPINQGLKFTVAGPMKPELLALQKEHDEFLKRPKEERTKAALAAFTDKSVPNLSSLVVLAELGNKRILFTGDARGDKVLAGLESVGLLKANGKMHVDILKVPHHGSSRNAEPILFSRITADHYVFSGNGEHGNPERETLEMLAGARPADDFEVHLTYPVDSIDAERKVDWEKQQKRKSTGRVAWSPKKHSLSAFFAGNPAFEKKIRIVDQVKPHVLDLGDKLGF